MPDTVKIHFLTENEFRDIKCEWNNLLDRSNLQSFFLKWEWLYSYWETVRDKDSKLNIYIFRIDSNIVGILPLYLKKATYYSIPVKKLTFLGNDVASDYMDIICLPEYQELCCNAFFMNVCRNRNNYCKFTVLEFQSLTGNSYLFKFFKNKQRILLNNETICPRVLLPKKYDDYLKNFSSKGRWQIRRKEKKICEKFDSVIVEFCSLKDNKSLIHTLFDLHKQRWETVRNNRSTFYNEFRIKFTNSFINRCKENDVLFSLVKINNEIASIIFMFVYKNNVFYYQNGWLPKYSKYSIGLFHIYKIINFLIKNKFNSFDLLRGDEEYKLRLKAENRKTYTLLYFNTFFLGLILRMLYRIIQTIKPVIKKIFTLSFNK